MISPSSPAGSSVGACSALVLAAPTSGSGKTVLTLALLRAFRQAGVAVAAAKVGPDYIDPCFHAVACGRPSLNLDPWAMRPDTLSRVWHRIGAAAPPPELLLVEGVMGLFDGAADGTGSTADLAQAWNWPVVLVVDTRSQAHSITALVHGFRTFRPDVGVAAVILNRVGSPRHEAMLRDALAPLDLPVVGAVPRLPALELPERHLGLVQAEEQPELTERIESAAAEVARCVDLPALRALARPGCTAIAADPAPPLPPLGQRIAVARDVAFAFVYPHVLEGWQSAGAEITFFSPLADQGPDPGADAIYLPGGYPELHAGTLAAAGKFLGGLQQAAARGTVIYGECGGFMTLGCGLEDQDGHRHALAGLLPLVSSFARRRLQLGYRRVKAVTASPLGPAGSRFRGHEFHYATIQEQGGAPLFHAWNARNELLAPVGLQVGSVMGSFVHLVDREAG